MKPRFTSRRILITGIVVFSVLYGIEAVLSVLYFPTQLFDHVVWILLYGYCTFLVIRQKGISLDALSVVRFLIVAIIFSFFIWLKPWTYMTGIASYASGLPGAVILLIFLNFIATILGSGFLFFVIGVTTKGFPKLSGMLFLRYLLVAVFSAIIVTVIGVLSFFITESVLSPAFEIACFFDGMFSQLAFGITYYYTGSLFIDDMRAPVRKVQE